jgi:hypothetical protein
MRNLIVELHIFKEDNKKLKKAQKEQKEINDVLLRSIVTKKIPKDDNYEEEVVKGPPRILVLKKKRGTTHLKIKQKQEEKENR